MSSAAISGDRSPPGNPSPGETPADDKKAKVSVGNDEGGRKDDGSSAQNGVIIQSRSGRPTRACTVRAAAWLQQQLAPVVRKPKAAPKKEWRVEEPPSPPQQCGSRVVTSLVEPPQASLLPRWNLRCMWELASVLNFLHVFRPLLNITAEFSAEEFETALITPNDTLWEIHMPLLKVIPPNTRNALTRDTWVTVLCRKLRDWWHWVAEGELPIVASHGAEIETYRSLDPSVRVVILKALCDIRVEQDDIRNYIESSLKQGLQLSAFSKERVGGDSYGVHYWYEDDPILGHRLYREIRKVEVKRAKARGSQVVPIATYQWETVATNFHEFQDVSEKLCLSSNRSEASLGEKLKIDMHPEIEKVHKRKERLLKKQHREVLLLDNVISIDGLGPGRALRGRKPVTYTFDDYDRSINEAIKITKRKDSSPEPIPRRSFNRQDISTNGNCSEPLDAPLDADFTAASLNSPYTDEEHNLGKSDRRQRKRPQHYPDTDFTDSDAEAGLDSDEEDIVGEAVFDEEYLRKRKQRKLSSSSEEEYHMEEDNGGEDYEVEDEEEEEEEEEEEDSLGISEDDSDSPKHKNSRGRTRRETKLRSVKEIQTGTRRSRRATKNPVNYRQYEYSDSETESAKPEKWDPQSNEPSEEASESFHSDSDGSHESENDNGGDGDDEQELKPGLPIGQNRNSPPEKPNNRSQDIEDEAEGGKRRFLDLNELAPGSGIDDGPPPNNVVKDEGTHDF